MKNARSLETVTHTHTQLLCKLTLQSSGVFRALNNNIKISKVMHSK